jgi:hypothetical protein
MAIRDMLFYTEGRGQRESRDRYWHDQRVFDLAEHPDLVEWIRGGEVGTIPELTPMSQRKPPRAVAASSPVEAAPPVPITQADVDREREKWERTKAMAREMQAQSPNGTEDGG